MQSFALTAKAIGISVVLIVCHPAADAFAGTAPLPWGTDVFAGEPAEILRAVESLAKSDADKREYILHSEKIEVAADHKVRRQVRTVYRIRTNAEAESLGSIQAAWNPWLHRKPTIRVRVISPDGRAHPLDETTIVQSADHNVQGSTFRNNRILTAPLPAIRMGSVVETEVVTEQHRAFCPVGIVGAVTWDAFAHVNKRVIEVKSHVDLPLKLTSTGKPIPLKMAEEGDYRVWRFEADSQQPLTAYWAYLPKGESNFSYVTYATGESWSAVAAYYHRLVEEQIKNANVSELVEAVAEESMSSREKIAAACRSLHDAVRYTGIEFGAGAIVPRAPDETIRRGYGDCKDKASLLVAMLRECEIEAYVALINATNPQDVAPDAPGLNAFDHVIVRIPDQPGVSALWIDPTDPFSSLGYLPLACQNRSTLVAAPETQTLSRTTGTTASDNRHYHFSKYYLDVNGKSRVESTTKSFGTLASQRRSTLASMTKEQLIDSWKQRSGEGYEMEGVEYRDPYDVTDPQFEVSMVFTDSEIASVEDGRMQVYLSAGTVFDELPYEFTSSVEAEDESEVRTAPFSLPHLYSNEKVYHLIPPPGFVASDLPEDQKIRVGELEVGLQSSLTDKGAIEIRLYVNTGNGILSVDQAKEFQEAFLLMSEDTPAYAWSIPVTFNYEPGMTFREQVDPGSIRELIRYAKEHPERVFYQGELAEALTQVGLLEEAREVTAKLVLRWPKKAAAHYANAWVNLHNQFGNSIEKGMLRDEALAAIRRAVELNEEDTLTKYNCALLLEHDALARRYRSAEEELKEAEEIYKDVYDSSGFQLALSNMGPLLLLKGDTRGLKRLVGEHPHDPTIMSLYAAAVATKRGSATASKLLSRSSFGSDERTLIEQTVTSHLRHLGRYDLVKEFVRRNPEHYVNQNVLLALERIDEHELSPDDPARPLQALLTSWLSDEATQDGFAEHYENSHDVAAMQLERSWIDPTFTQVRELIRAQFGSIAPAKDILSLYRFESRGDDSDNPTAFELTATPSADLRGWPVMKAFGIRAPNGTTKLYARGPKHQEIGRKVLEFLEADNLHAARLWLECVYDIERPRINLFNVFAGTPFARLSSIMDRQSSKDLRLAALLLASRNEHSNPKYLEELSRGIPERPPAWQLQMNRARCQRALLLQQYDSVLSTLEELTKRNQSSPEFLDCKLRALVGKNSFEEASTTLQNLRMVSQDSAMYPAGLLLEKSEGQEAVYDYFQQQLGRTDLTEGSRNNALVLQSWRALFVRKSAEVISRDSELQAIATHHRSADLTHTMACLYADVGRLRDAIDALNSCFRLRGDRFDSVDNWVLGRIAEQCGLTESARKYFLRVEDSVRPRGPSSCWSLAQDSLKRLNQASTVSTAQKEQPDESQAAGAAALSEE